MAPVNSSHFKEMKDEIEKLEKINNIVKENNKEKIKTQTYYEKHGKPHPFVR